MEKIIKTFDDGKHRNIDNKFYLGPGHTHGNSDLKEIEFAEGLEVVEEEGKIVLKIQAINSSPPSGCFQIKNLYVNPANGKLVVQYDDGE
jgi:hypothetical protein